MAKTIGETRIRTEFNASQNGLVDQIKQKAAELINLIDGSITAGSPDVVRWKSIAMTEIETAALYAVKAATA